MRKSLFIVGAGPGIGAATADRFGREGWTIIAGARNSTRLEAFVSAISANGIIAHGVEVDARNPTTLRAAMIEADRLAGGLGAVMFNAAIVRQQNLLDMTDDEIDSDIATNVAGGLHTIRTAVELFGAHGGTILVTGGGLALTPHPSYTVLGASKAALRNAVQALSQDLAARKIHIAIATVATSVAPNSPEARGVAETFWTLATNPSAGWEARFPA
ncbi:SDR family oxidoreductase [Roseomonas sp. WA12]